MTATIALTNAILSANDAMEGGAIYLTDADASVTIGWSDFYDNGDTPFYQLTAPGDPTVMDPDGSVSDMGAYGGPGGGDW